MSGDLGRKYPLISMESILRTALYIDEYQRLQIGTVTETWLLSLDPCLESCRFPWQYTRVSKSISPRNMDMDTDTPTWSANI